MMTVMLDGMEGKVFRQFAGFPATILILDAPDGVFCFRSSSPSIFTRPQPF
jgi:hypothetical protein